MKHEEIEIGWVSKSYRIAPCVQKLCDHIEAQRLVSKEKQEYNKYMENVMRSALNLLKKESVLYILCNQKRIVKGIAYSPDLYDSFTLLYDDLKICFPKLTKGQFVESLILSYVKYSNSKLFENTMKKERHFTVDLKKKMEEK